MKRKIDVSTLFLIIIVCFFVCIFIVPMLYGIGISFTDWNGLSREQNFVGLQNYIRMFSDERFLASLKTTLNYAFILLFFALTLGLLFAKAILRCKKYRPSLLFIMFFPYVITPVIVCVLWNQIFIGLLPEFAKLLDISFLKTSLLANKNVALYAVSFVDLWMLIPYAMILFLSALTTIPTEIMEYSSIEGVTWRQRLIFIEFPYILSTVGMIATVVFSYAFTHIDTLMTLTSGGPGRMTETLYYTIYKNSTLEQKYAYGLAESLVVSIGSIVVFLLTNRITNRKQLEDIEFSI